MARQYDAAIAALSRATMTPIGPTPISPPPMPLAGRPDRARHHAAEVLRLFPAYSVSRHATGEPYKRPSDLELLTSGLRQAGLPD